MTNIDDIVDRTKFKQNPVKERDSMVQIHGVTKSWQTAAEQYSVQLWFYPVF